MRQRNDGGDLPIVGTRLLTKEDVVEMKAKLLGSFLLFTQTFYKLRTGRDFELSFPPGRESHYVILSRAFTKVFRNQSRRLMVNIPPRYAKTEMAINFIAWTIAHYPDSNNLYLSYGHNLAAKQTQTIRQIIDLPYYRKLFGIELSGESSAKDNFETTAHGSVYAAGSGGSVTGRGAGIKNCGRWGGCIIIDDIHKPSEVTSDLVRTSTIDWYYNTLQSRLNDPVHTPIIFIGQRLHEDDLPAHLLRQGGWDTVILPALDMSGNPLHEKMHSREMLLKMQAEMPYDFSSQYQQNPQPAGGGIFKPEWFLTLDKEPDILATFITADTAETQKEYNDATVFCFWGIYRVEGRDLYCLHWLDCVELRVEPKDLSSEFMAFYSQCMRHPVKPSVAAIEKKSTGVTLLSTLKEFQGLQVMDIERHRGSGSKTDRFLTVQPYVASHRVTFTVGANHADMCIEHCRKITANNTHRFDDICDNLADAIRIALIDGIIIGVVVKDSGRAHNEVLDSMMGQFNRLNRLKGQRKWTM